MSCIFCVHRTPLGHALVVSLAVFPPSLWVWRTVSTEAKQVLMGAFPLDLEIAAPGTYLKVKRVLRIFHLEVLTNEEAEQIVVHDCYILLWEIMTFRSFRWQSKRDTSDQGRTQYPFIKDARLAGSDMKFDL